MMELMTAAPIAAVDHGLSITEGAFIVQWHMVGMFAPALVAGWLVGKIGGRAVMTIGIAALIGGAVIDNTGVTQSHFMTGLLLVGLGWNFMYVSGTTFIASSYNERERSRAQGGAEVLTMSGSALGALSSGTLLTLFGWTVLNMLVLVPLLVCTGLLLHLARTCRRRSGSVLTVVHGYEETK